jgi:subtilase family protein
LEPTRFAGIQGSCGLTWQAVPALRNLNTQTPPHVFPRRPSASNVASGHLQPATAIPAAAFAGRGALGEAGEQVSYHIVLKLRRRLERDLAIPYWPDFIMDKTGALDSVEPDVTVAVLDTGADVDHVELRGKFAAQADFVDLKSLDTTDFIGDIANPDADAVGHGTHVSGNVRCHGQARRARQRGGQGAGPAQPTRAGRPCRGTWAEQHGGRGCSLRLAKDRRSPSDHGVPQARCPLANRAGPGSARQRPVGLIQAASDVGISPKRPGPAMDNDASAGQPEPAGWDAGS